MNARDLVFHATAIKRHAPAEAIAALAGLPPEQVRAELAGAVATGRAVEARGAYALTPLAGVALQDFGVLRDGRGGAVLVCVNATAAQRIHAGFRVVVGQTVLLFAGAQVRHRQHFFGFAKQKVRSVRDVRQGKQFFQFHRGGGAFARHEQVFGKIEPSLELLFTRQWQGEQAAIVGDAFGGLARVGLPVLLAINAGQKRNHFPCARGARVGVARKRQAGEDETTERDERNLHAMSIIA